MLRVIGLLILVAAAMLAAVWFAERPGQVSIVWQGWRIDTSFGLMLVSAVGVAIAAIFLAAVWRGLVTGPKRFVLGAGGAIVVGARATARSPAASSRSRRAMRRRRAATPAAPTCCSTSRRSRCCSRRRRRS